MRERTILQWKGQDTDDASEYGYRDDCAGCVCQDNCLDATKCKCQQESAVYDGRIRKEAEIDR
ncbi:hypothetical protein AAVH_07341 [Aphelenchoides avenae]|nr:hypothetical protein AAVH_07341 [Aphelenchus avenae]